MGSHSGTIRPILDRHSRCNPTTTKEDHNPDFKGLIAALLPKPGDLVLGIKKVLNEF